MHKVLALCLIAFSAEAQTPPIETAVGCVGDKIILVIAVRESGIYKLAIPHNVCGVDV